MRKLKLESYDLPKIIEPACSVQCSVLKPVYPDGSPVLRSISKPIPVNIVHHLFAFLNEGHYGFLFCFVLL